MTAPKAMPTSPILAALQAAQAKARAVRRDGRNETDGYDYATAEQIIEEAKALLAAEGLAVMPLSVEVGPPLAGTTAVAMLVTTWSLVHRRHGEHVLGARERGTGLDDATPTAPATGARRTAQPARPSNAERVRAAGARIGAEYRRLGIAQERQAEHSKRLLGRRPSSPADFEALAQRLAALGTGSSEQTRPVPSQPPPSSEVLHGDA
jgi:hypothetical protein